MTERAIMQKTLGDTEVPIGVTTCTRGSSRHVPKLQQQTSWPKMMINTTAFCRTLTHIIKSIKLILNIQDMLLNTISFKRTMLFQYLCKY